MVRQPVMREDHSDTLISDFSDPVFQDAFKRYFAEIGVNVKDWDGLFREMNEGNEGEKNAAYVRRTADGVIGFVMFVPIRFTSWFFEETCGFIREFWVADEFRSKGHGSELLALAERHFLEHGIYASILTTETAQRFYERHGYARALGCHAKNKDEVFTKRLGQAEPPKKGGLG